jgi:predicted nuclease with RNAse H fold
LASAALLGVDVGFAKTRRSTGLAWLLDGKVQTAITGSSWQERSRDLPKGISFSIAALDAPIVDNGENHARGCEAMFYRGAFAKRCKPGLSHHGRGLLLREAGRQAAADFAPVLIPIALPFGLHVIEGVPIIEAFPNTFLGVLLPDATFATWSRKSGKAKSDWLYEQVAAAGMLRRLLSALDLTSSTKHFESTLDHDERAALMCLLTACFAFAGEAVVVGDRQGGWFWLPPIAFWEPWAVAALETNSSPALRRRFPGVGHWHPSPIRSG